jgi:hypothetical protein
MRQFGSGLVLIGGIVMLASSVWLAFIFRYTGIALIQDALLAGLMFAVALAFAVLGIGVRYLTEA